MTHNDSDASEVARVVLSGKALPPQKSMSYSPAPMNRTVRLGSRLSIVEKHLDDTHNVLAGMEHLRSKSTAQGQEIKSLTLKLAELSALVGVEDRLKGLLEIAQVRA